MNIALVVLRLYTFQKKLTKYVKILEVKLRLLKLVYPC